MKTYIHGVRHNFKVGQIVKTKPEAWRKTTSFVGKIREITPFGGLFISRMLGKKNASLTSTYYGHEEIEGR